jgi:hypothetical protein
MSLSSSRRRHSKRGSTRTDWSRFLPSVRGVAAVVVGVLLAIWALGNFVSDRSRKDAEAEDLQSIASAIATGTPAALDQIAARATSRIDAEPLSVFSLMTLVLTATAGQDSQTADNIRAVILARTKRDTTTLLWSINRSLIRSDVAGAVIGLDLLLRLSPSNQIVSSSVATLTALASNSVGLFALVVALNRSPGWKRAFLSQLASAGPSGLFPDLMGRFAPSDMPGIDPAWNVYFFRLVLAGQGTAAYPLWAGMQPDRRLALLGNLFDGGFESDPDGTVFDWALGRQAGSSVTMAVPQEASQGRALAIDFSGASVSAPLARQFTILPPGHFRLRGKVKLNNLETERGLSWQIVCLVGAKGTQIAETERFSGSRSWTEFSTDVEIPSTQCSTQSVQLTLPARIHAERVIRGQAWFDNLAIERVDP